MLLVLWGNVRLFGDGMGTKLAEKYYGGVGAASNIQLVFASAEVVIGALVVLGLFRRVALVGAAIILAAFYMTRGSSGGAGGGRSAGWTEQQDEGDGGVNLQEYPAAEGEWLA